MLKTISTDKHKKAVGYKKLSSSPNIKCGLCEHIYVDDRCAMRDLKCRNINKQVKYGGVCNEFSRQTDSR